MSKTYKSIPIILCIVLIFSACTKQNLQVEKLLSDAQQSMDVNPEFALAILEESIDAQELTTKQYALWCLLLTKAKDKNYRPHASDSLINIAMTHYEKTNEADLLMESYYYMGRVNDDLGNALNTQRYYLKALEAGKHSNNYQLLMRICYSIGSMYLYQDVYELALKYLKESLGYAQINGDSVFQMYGLRDIARHFSTQNNQDSALVYYLKALNYADSTSRFSVLNELGGTYRRIGAHAESYKHLSEALNCIPHHQEDDYLHIHLNLGITHWCMNEPDSARVYLEKALTSNYIHTEEKAAYYLYKLAKQKNDTSKALHYLEQSRMLNDSIAKENNAEALRKVQTLYNHQQSDSKIKELALANAVSQSNFYKIMAIALACVMLVIVVSTVSVNLLKRYRIKKMEVDVMASELRDRSSRLRMSEIRIRELEAHIKESMDELEKEKTINTGLREEQKLRELAIGKLENSDVYLKFHAFASSQDTEIRITPEDKKALEQIIEDAYPGFSGRIVQQSPLVNDVDLYLCHLHKIGITSPKKLTKFIHMADNSVVSRRDRLYSKLHGVKGNAELFVEYINSL